MSKSPPIPPANRSRKGPGAHTETDAGDKTDPGAKTGNVQGAPDPEHKGQQANTRQNTHNQGYQQDR